MVTRRPKVSSLAIRMDLEMREKLDRVAAAQHRKVSDLARIWLEDRLLGRPVNALETRDGHEGETWAKVSRADLVALEQWQKISAHPEVRDALNRLCALVLESVEVRRAVVGLVPVIHPEGGTARQGGRQSPKVTRGAGSRKPRPRR